MRIKETDLSPFRDRPNSWLSMRHLKLDVFTESDKEFSELGNHSGGLSEYDGGFAVVFAYDSNIPPLTDDKWIAFSHQTAGTACHNRNYIGFVITPRPELHAPLREIAKRYFYYRSGNFSRSNIMISDIIEYNSAIQNIGLSCERSYRLLEEGIYPIDATLNNMQVLIGEDLPLPDIYGGLNKHATSGGTIFLLADNSD